MAYTLITKKRFNNKVAGVLKYLEKEWNKKVAANFLFLWDDRLRRRTITPFSGCEVGLKDVRSVFITKHNRLYYRVVGNTVIILNMYDTRINPEENLYKK